MKKISFLLLTALTFVTLSCKAQTNADIADKFVKALSENQYDVAAKLFGPEVGNAVNADVLKDGWSQIEGMFGKFQSHQLSNATPDANPIVVNIKFANKDQGFSCTFNKNQELLGFVLVPPTETSAGNAATIASAFREEEVSVKVNGGTLKGTIMYPDNTSGKLRVAIIIAGSGATDRDGNSGNRVNTNAYKMIAEALAEQGIASLRYDKRMIAASNDFDPDESKLRFEDYASDVMQLGEYLRKQKKASGLYVIGHSEGAMVGMLSANKLRANAYVSVCGPGENIAATLQRQIADERVVSILDSLKKGVQLASVPSEFQAAFRLSVQPYLISWMKYEPAMEIKKLNMPVMIIAGTTDIQVPVADAEALKKAKPTATLSIIEGMNHVLKNAPADKAANMVTYTQSSLPLNTEFVRALTSFLKEK